jgi:PAS domain S-box-containing protein
MPVDKEPEASGDTARRKQTLEELKEENERLRRDLDMQRRRFEVLLEHIPEGVLFVEGPEIRITAISKHGQEMLGYPLPSLLQRSIRDYLDRLPARVPFTQDLGLLRAARSGESTFNEELVYRRPDGTELVILSNSGPVLDKEGKIRGAIVVWTDITERKFTEEALSRARRDFRNLAAHLDQSWEDQNRRIAREIHDELGQALAAAKIELTMVELGLPPDNDSLRQRVQTISLILNDVMAGMRRISGGLRPSILDHLGLEAAIDWLTLDFSERTGIECDFQAMESETVPDDRVSLALYRILEEALGNVERHAGAKRVKVKLQVINRNVQLEVSDDGAGFDISRIPPGAFGVLGMKERARRLGGLVTIESGPGAGTRLVAVLPLQQP